MPRPLRDLLAVLLGALGVLALQRLLQRFGPTEAYDYPLEDPLPVGDEDDLYPGLQAAESPAPSRPVRRTRTRSGADLSRRQAVARASAAVRKTGRRRPRPTA